jgi:hypothetical protein
MQNQLRYLSMHSLANKTELVSSREKQWRYLSKYARVKLQFTLRYPRDCQAFKTQGHTHHFLSTRDPLVINEANLLKLCFN